MNLQPMRTRNLLSICCAALALVPAIASAEGNKVVIGRVGQVIEASKVYTRASTRAGSYFKVKADEKLKYATADKTGTRTQQARDLLQQALDAAREIGNDALVQQTELRLSDLA